MNVSVVEVIQSMLAPGLMISACGLLLLSMNNKYSMVVNRIRLLEDEKRRLSGKTLQDADKERFNNVNMQLKKFAFRVKLVRNAVLSYSTAVAFFIVASLTIGLQFMMSSRDISGVVILLFLAGMLSVFVGIISAAMEMRMGYQIISIELDDNTIQ